VLEQGEKSLKIEIFEYLSREDRKPFTGSDFDLFRRES